MEPELDGDALVAEARLLRWEARFERAILRALGRAEDEALAALRSLTATAIAEPIEPSGWTRILEAEISPVAASIVDEVGAALLDSTPDEFDAYVAFDFSAQVGRLVSRVADMTLDVARKIGETLRTGAARGEGYDALSARVQDVFDANAHRARRIARTEVASAASAAAHAGAEALSSAGLTIEKRWVATPDERTRLTHRLAHGQRRALDQPFDVGRAQLAFPCDPTGPPEEVIACRCAARYDVVE